MNKLLVIVSFSLVSQIVYSQPTNIDIVDFIRESQQWVKDGKRMQFSWWLPQEYWRIALAGNSEIPEGVVEQLEMVFQDYVLVCAADITVLDGGYMEFAAEDNLRSTISVTDLNGKVYKPLGVSEISDDANAVAENIKPVLAQSLGQMGRGMHFFFFSVNNNSDENLIQATKPGYFIVHHSGKEFKWTLPMSVLLPLKFCPVDKEKMKGSWNYCPTHGVKLNSN